MNNPRYSVIVPVYNRPDEVRDLLKSLLTQTQKSFEVIVVEDGSTVSCEPVINEFSSRLPLRYYFKPNSGPGPSRNLGFQHAHGEYFVVFDSDCILPADYFALVDTHLRKDPLDAWGGPDKAHAKFTVIQRAMGYTMSSVLTTGGIRGAKQRLGWFQPRSFNMGISKKVFEVTGGFRFDRYAEDIEFSTRIKKEGFRVGLIPEAFVYHKRRTSFTQFIQQVYNFGKGRALLGKFHPEEIKIAHWFPTLFMLGTISIPLLYFISKTLFSIALAFFGLYLCAIFVHAFMLTGNLFVACLSVWSALLQLCGYGAGFVIEYLKKSSAADKVK